MSCPYGKEPWSSLGRPTNDSLGTVFAITRKPQTRSNPSILLKDMGGIIAMGPHLAGALVASRVSLFYSLESHT